MKKKIKSVFIKITLIFILLIGIFSFVAYRYFQNELKPMAESNEETIEIVVPMGSSRDQIGTILEDNELIKSSLIFKIYTKMKDENNFQAGTYQMSQSMALEDIISYLNEGGTPIQPDPIARLSIPEGISIEEIADRFEKHGDFTSENMIEVIQDAAFIESMVEKYPDLLTEAVEASEVTRYTLEGYLFPATYEIFEDSTIENIVEEMLDQMNQVMSPYYEKIHTGDLNVHEILTLASYIEGEGTSDEDRELVSGVFYNRIELGMPLQTDPSVSYALGEHRERVSYKDLEVDSPYNTYMYKGIGAGPINSPSESAIKASINPVETDYLYFLADLKTGKVYFAEDYNQHLEYKREYLDNN